MIFKRILWLFERAGSGIPNSLTGKYEFCNDTLVGYVVKVPLVSNHGLCVQARREGRVIATWPLDPWGAGDRTPFKIPIDGRFSAREVVCDTITIVANTARGDTGTITMDAANRFDFIRDFFGEPAETELDLNFTRGGNAGPYLGIGWYGASDSFTCTVDYDSLIHFVMPSKPGKYLLRMRYSSYIFSEHRPNQTLGIYFNETQIGEIISQETDSVFRELEIVSAPELLGLAVTLRLHHPDAERPCDHGDSADTRRLSFAFRHITIVRVANS
jgi:hypothetical protein